MIFDAVYFDVALPATLAMMIERFRKRWYRFAEKKQTNKSKKTMERKEKKK